VSAVGLVAVIGASPPSNAEQGVGRDPAAFEARGETADLSSVEVEREFTDSGVKWSVLTYDSSEGPCLSVHGELPSASAEAGSVESCGIGEDAFDWTVGGVALGGGWYSIAMGRTPPGGHVEVSLRDGSVLTDPLEKTGVWLLIIPSQGIDRDLDVISIAAWTTAGEPLGTVAPETASDLEERVAALNTGAPSLSE
jgi:hypothetical protein